MEGNIHNRTFDANDKSRIYMNFTDDESKGFTSFADCFEHW